jgi:hypothetical protein
LIPLHWNFKDIFRACRLGLSAKKIWMEFVGLLIGGAGYTLLTYVAYAASGVPTFAVWERFSLVPFLDPELAPVGIYKGLQWWSWVIWAAGIVWFIVVNMMTGTAVSKVVLEQLRGDDFFESREALNYARQRAGALFAAPLMPLLFAAFIVVCGLILSLLGAIPVIGEILVGALAVPAFGASLFVVYLLIVFVVAILLVPVVVGTTRNDSFDALFEVFSCVNEQSWRLVLYAALLKVLALIGTAVLAVLSVLAIKLGGGIVGVFTGDKLMNIMSGAPFYLHLSLPSWCPLSILNNPSGFLLGGGDLLADGISQNIAALLVGIAAYVVLLVVAGYGLSIWHTGMTLCFCVLIRKKDDKNLLEEKDTEELLAEEEQKLPEPAGGAAPAEAAASNGVKPA